MILYGYVIISQSSFRWDLKKPAVIYGQNATLSCNGNGCMPISIRKWIGGPTSDVLCFNDYSSNPAKYQLMYNKTKPSFDLMIKNFNFTDANCTYTCACGFFQYTHMLQLDEIDFVYPPDKDLNSETKQKDGKLHIDMSMTVYPLPTCTIFYEKIVLPVDTKIIDVQEEIGVKLYRLKLEYILNVEYKNCKGNLSLSCKVRSLEFHMLQQKLNLCKDHPDTKHSSYLGIVLGLVCGISVLIAIAGKYAWSKRNGRNNQKTTSRNNVAYSKQSAT